MTTDKATIDVYNARSEDYAQLNGHEANSPELQAFIARLPVKAHVLDLGCGPGHMAKTMIKAGHVVDAVDASPEMVTLAHKSMVPARVARFEDIDENEVYDAVWASFSLLHVPRDAFPDLLESLFKALKPGGLFYIGMKLGDGEYRDGIGRFYTYYTEDELLQHLEHTGLTDPQITRGTSTGLSGEEAEHITITLRKPAHA